MLILILSNCLISEVGDVATPSMPLSNIELDNLVDLLTNRDRQPDLRREPLFGYGGVTFGDLVSTHRTRFALDDTNSCGHFISVAYSEPDVRINNLIGADISGDVPVDGDIVGLTSLGVGTLYELVRLVEETGIGDIPGRIWILNQFSSLNSDKINQKIGSGFVCTVDVNQSESGWLPFGLTDSVGRLSVTDGEPSIRSLNKYGFADSWISAFQFTCPIGETVTFCDYDLSLDHSWSASLKRV